MTTYNTGNPLGSSAAKDLYDNAQNLDFAVNSITQTLWGDRFGQQRKTWYGIEKLAQEAISAFGYITLDSFEDGANITLPNQVLRWKSNGEYYRWDGDFPKLVASGSTPSNSGGIGLGAWLTVGDSTLRSNLQSHSEGMGASIVGTFNGSNVQDELNSFKSNDIGKGASLIGINGGTNLQDVFSSDGSNSITTIGETLLEKRLGFDDNGALYKKSSSWPEEFKKEGFSLTSGVFDGILKIKVGASGYDFNLLSSAIAFASLFKPKYITSSDFTQNRIEIQIQSGFVISEPIVARQIDLSHITITSVDSIVKVNYAAPSGLWWMYGEYGAHLPVIATIFDLQHIGYDGLALKMGSQAVFEYGHSRDGKPETKYAGIINAARHNLFINTGSHVVGRECVFTGAIEAGVHLEKNCTGCVRDSDISNNGIYGVRLINGSTLDIYGVNVSGVNAGYGVLTEVGSIASGFGINANNCKIGLRASGGSKIVAPSSTFSGMGSTDPWANASEGSEIIMFTSTGSGGASACLSNTGSKVDVHGVDASAAGSVAGQFRCLAGSTICASSTTGTFNKAVNTIDGNGIIFK